jgi:hypothetical protein
MTAMVNWNNVNGLVPAAKTLGNEFNKIAPNRDGASDGAAGDSAHQEKPSDHNWDETGNTPDKDSDNKNEIHAIDVTAKLNAAFTMHNCIDYTVDECRKPNDVGKDKGRLKYIIYDGYIWEASHSWAKRVYTGSNKHREHAHFSFEYGSEYSEDTSPFGLVTKFGGEVTEEELIAAMNKWWNAQKLGAETFTVETAIQRMYFATLDGKDVGSWLPDLLKGLVLQGQENAEQIQQIKELLTNPTPSQIAG